MKVSKSKYRPFSDEEIWVNPMLVLFKKIKHQKDKEIKIISILTTKKKKILCQLGIGNNAESLSLIELFKDYVFLDNTPIGIKKE